MRTQYQTNLYHGLPAISKDGEQWIVFSPLAGALVQLGRQEFASQWKHQELVASGFFSAAAASDPPKHTTPFHLTLVTTPECNLRCKYCFAAGSCHPDHIEAHPAAMPVEVAEAAVRYAMARSSGRDVIISFFGGEPTLTPTLIKHIVGYAKTQAKAAGVKETFFNITTNGAVRKSVLEFLLHEGFFVTVSMDGVPEIQDWQRPLANGKKSSTLVERTLRSLASAGVDFLVRVTVTRKSVQTMSESVDYLAELGVPKVHFEAVSIAGRALLEPCGEATERPTAEEFSESLMAAIVEGGNTGVGVMNSAYMNLLRPTEHFCDGCAGNRLSITHGGLVSTCLEVQGTCHPASGHFIVGRHDGVRGEITVDKQSLATVCSRTSAYRATPCVTCFARLICGGGCPMRNFHMTGGINSVDVFRCEVVNRVLPYVIDMVNQNSDDPGER